MAEIIEIKNDQPQDPPKQPVEKKPFKARLLSEFTMDEGADILVQITEPLLDMLSDTDLIDSLKAETGEHASAMEIKRIGIVKFTKLFNVVLNKRRDNLFNVIAPFFGVDAAVIHKTGLLKVMGEVYRIWRDKDFQDFLAELRGGVQS